MCTDVRRSTSRWTISLPLVVVRQVVVAEAAAEAAEADVVEAVAAHRAQELVADVVLDWARLLVRVHRPLQVDGAQVQPLLQLAAR
jgi:hypothetical protein